MSHVTHITESCRRSRVSWVLWHQHYTANHCNSLQHMSHVTHLNESCHKFEWVMPQVTSFVGAVASVSGMNATKATNAQWDRVKQALNIVSVSQCVAVCCSGLPMLGKTVSNRPLISCVCCSVLQHVAVRCSVLQWLLTHSGTVSNKPLIL